MILDQISKKLAAEMGLKPIPEGQVVEFQLCVVGRIDPWQKLPIIGPNYSLPAFADIVDPHDEEYRFKTIQHQTGNQPRVDRETKRTVFDPVLSGVDFKKGRIVLRPDQSETYFFLMLHPKNRDNPYKRRIVEDLFYKVDKKADTAKRVANFDYKVDAMSLLRVAEGQEIRAIAYALKEKGFSVDLNQDPLFMKDALISVAENQPEELIWASNDRRAQARIMIDQGMRLNWLMFDEHPDRRIWYWMNSGEDESNRQLIRVDVGNKPIEALIDFMTDATDKGGSEHYAELNQRYRNYKMNAEKALM